MTNTLPTRLFTDDRDAMAAGELLDQLQGGIGDLRVGRHDDTPVAMPSELQRLLRRVLRSVAEGKTITIGALPETLTTSHAAALLGISRPTLMNKIRAGQLPAHKVGTHTRLRSADVLAFRREQQKRRREAFDTLRELMDDDLD